MATRAARLFAGLFAVTQAIGACSAGGSGSSPTVETDDGSSPPVFDDGRSNTPPPLVGGGGLLGVDDSGEPVNVGTELVCDGIDDNGNGIIDDVDVGRDGLCDCLRIGFLGVFASDAGNATGAFESWLEARSSVPITNIGPTQPLTAELLADLQVIVVGNLAQRANAGGFTPAEVQALVEWVQAGGGLMTLAGYTAREGDIVPTTQLLAPFGLGYDYQGRGAGVLSMGAPPMIVTGIVAPMHPAVENITALGVYAAYPVTGDGETIVREGSFDLAQAKLVGEGRVFAFSDEWITQDRLWLPMQQANQTPCQQRCNQCNNECARCDAQCTQCSLEPCQGGQMPLPGETCARGCDQACTQCSMACTTCEAACAECSALEQQNTLDIPRFWLNVMRWLTPANECQVVIPPVVF